MNCCANLDSPILKSLLSFIFIIFLINYFFPAVVDEWEDATMFSYLDMRDKTAVLTKRMKYFTNNGKQTHRFSLYFTSCR